jgi:cysteine desulfurase
MVASTVEHSAVRQSVIAFESATAGAVTLTGCDGRGRIDASEIIAALTPDTALVHIQWANHEVGTIQPVADVVEACREREVLVHVDAAAAIGHLPISFRDLGADLLSVSAHKIGGPPGVGALLVRRGIRLRPLLVGGDQERARRAGFENVPGIVGFGATCASLAGDILLDETLVQVELTRRILEGAAAIDGVHVYGDPVDRVPHLVCLGIDGIEPQAVLLGLDRAGIAAHSGSACSSEALEPSPVLEAMGVDAHRSLRLSVGWNTTDTDVDRLLAVLPEVIADLRALGA